MKPVEVGKMKYVNRKNKRLSQSRTNAAAQAARFEGLESRTLFATVPVSGGVPLLSSNPTATTKLYLDFDGEAAGSWSLYGGSPISVPATPAYTSDSDATTFSD